MRLSDTRWMFKIGTATYYVKERCASNEDNGTPGLYDVDDGNEVVQLTGYQPEDAARRRHNGYGGSLKSAGCIPNFGVLVGPIRYAPGP